MKLKTFMGLALLYEKRFGPYFVELVTAGLQLDPKTNEPFIAAMDLIGCLMVTHNFVVSGSCTEQLYGMCESLWRPDMEPDDLFETISQALLNAVDRDALSGWGAVVATHTRERQSYNKDFESKNGLELLSIVTNQPKYQYI